MQVSQGSDTFEFRSPHGMKAAHSRLRTFAGIAVRHLQHFNYPGRAWHDLSGPQDTLTVVLAEIGRRCPDLCSGGSSCDNTFAGNWIALAMNYLFPALLDSASRILLQNTTAKSSVGAKLDN